MSARHFRTVLTEAHPIVAAATMGRFGLSSPLDYAAQESARGVTSVSKEKGPLATICPENSWMRALEGGMRVRELRYAA